MMIKIKDILSMGVVFSFFTLFVACEKECPEQDVDTKNAIFLQFNTVGDNAFTEAQLSSLFMVRFQTDSLDTLSFQADTFHYGQQGFYEDDYKIRISKYLPLWEETGAPYYTSYNYSFQNGAGDFNIILNDIDLIGSFDDDCIYTNTKKTFVLDGEAIDVSGSTDYVSVFN